MADYLEPDFQPVDDDLVSTRFLDDTDIEVVGGFRPSQPPEHVLFDFDGTLSLIREGWPEVMTPMMVEVLQQAGAKESAQELHAVCAKFTMELTGKQTVYQMIRLAEEVEKRGGIAKDPVEYKRLYHDRLMERIHSRHIALKSGAISPEQMAVPGSFALLDELKRRGVRLYLASGTDEHYVREEVSLLGLNQYFDEQIFGAVDDYRTFSKAGVIERILNENNVDGRKLLGFGDGYVEIQNVREAGGVSIAVASDETHRSGRPDPWKRRRLLSAGAHIVIPDYQQCQQLLRFIWPSFLDSA